MKKTKWFDFDAQRPVGTGFYECFYVKRLSSKGEIRIGLLFFDGRYFGLANRVFCWRGLAEKPVYGAYDRAVMRDEVLYRRIHTVART